MSGFNITDGTDHPTERTDAQLWKERNDLERKLLNTQLPDVASSIQERDRWERKYTRTANLTDAQYHYWAGRQAALLQTVLLAHTGTEARRYATVAGMLFVRMRDTG